MRRGGKGHTDPVIQELTLIFWLVSFVVREGAGRFSEDNASGVVVFGLHEAICGVGIAWHVSVLQIQPISQTTARADPSQGHRAGTGAPQPQNCK